MANLTEEYRTAARAAGWRRDPQRGRLRVTGRDATDFLHALVTADIASVPPDGGVYGAYLSPQGRMITDLAAYRTSEGWLLDLPPGVAASLATKLDGLIFAEDARVEDVTAATALIAVLGERAEEILASSLGLDRSALATLTVRRTLSGDGTLVARTDAATVPSFDIFCPLTCADDVASRLLEAGASEIAYATTEAFRIEAGRPAFGVDMNAETIPLEAGLLDRAISLTKGCYVGQEVIVRVLHRGGGRVVKKLMKIEATGDGELDPGAPIVGAGRDLGVVTSAAWSPSRERWIALGYIHRDGAEAGTAVVAGSTMATIVSAAG